MRIQRCVILFKAGKPRPGARKKENVALATFFLLPEKTGAGGVAV
jgi:hypothetical protein